MWADEAEVIFAQHHWPTWGNDNVRELREIADAFELPPSLATFWANRGYYGSVYHDVATTYVLYLGWFDGHPATLHELPPVEASVKYVEFMGGADAVLEKARASFADGDYRWVAEVVNHVVFADPDNQAARELQADALEQLGYQAESGPWRNFYLSGAKELRDGVVQAGTPNTASPDTIRAMTVDMFFDYLGVRLDSGRAGDAHITLNFDFGDPEGTYVVELVNGVLNHTAGVQADAADAKVTLSRDALSNIMLQQTTLDQAVAAGDVTVEGDQAKLGELVSYLDTFELWFSIVTP